MDAFGGIAAPSIFGDEALPRQSTRERQRIGAQHEIGGGLFEQHATLPGERLLGLPVADRGDLHDRAQQRVLHIERLAQGDQLACHPRQVLRAGPAFAHRALHRLAQAGYVEGEFGVAHRIDELHPQRRRIGAQQRIAGGTQSRIPSTRIETELDQPLVGGCEVRPQRNRPGERIRRLEAAQRRQCGAEPEITLRQAGVEAKRSLVGRGGIGRAAQLQQRIAQVELGDGARLQLGDAPVVALGIDRLPERAIGLGEPVMDRRHRRRDRQRPGEMRERIERALLPARDQAAQIQGLGMRGLGVQDAPAERIGLGQVADTQPGLRQCQPGAGARGVSLGLACGPTLPAVQLSPPSSARPARYRSPHPAA